MEWKPEKLCTSHNGYELLVERFKRNYHCESREETWKWRVIHSGIVMSQGMANDMASAQSMAEANLPQ